MTVIKNFYLGPAGALRVLPQPNDAYDNPRTRGDQATPALGGGTTVMRLLNSKGAWTFPYTLSPSVDADLISGFYDGLFDPPSGTDFCLIDPTVRNVLGLDVSTCGVRSAAAPGWVASTGTLAVTATAAPADAAISGVLTWTTPTAAATLQPGLVANVADITTAPPYVATEGVTVTLRVSCATSKSVSLQLVGYNAAGVVVGTPASTTATVGTAFTTMTTSIAVGAGAFASAVYVLPRLLVGASAPASISIAGGQLEYATAASAFQRGYGSPRVVIIANPARNVAAFEQFTHQLSLAET